MGKFSLGIWKVAASATGLVIVQNSFFSRWDFATHWDLKRLGFTPLKLRHGNGGFMLIYSNRSQIWMESQNTFQSIPPLPTLKRSFKKIVAINSLASKDNPIRKAQRSKNEVIKTGSYDNSHSPPLLPNNVWNEDHWTTLIYGNWSLTPCNFFYSLADHSSSGQKLRRFFLISQEFSRGKVRWRNQDQNDVSSSVQNQDGW